MRGAKMKARQAKKLLKELLARRIDVLTVPSGMAIGVKVARRAYYTRAQITTLCKGIIDATGLPVFLLPPDIELVIADGQRVPS
jgi:hypothetical protein